jgi:hypothetical protein
MLYRIRLSRQEMYRPKPGSSQVCLQECLPKDVSSVPGSLV